MPPLWWGHVWRALCSPAVPGVNKGGHGGSGLDPASPQASGYETLVSEGIDTIIRGRTPRRATANARQCTASHATRCWCGLSAAGQACRQAGATVYRRRCFSVLTDNHGSVLALRSAGSIAFRRGAIRAVEELPGTANQGARVPRCEPVGFAA